MATDSVMVTFFVNFKHARTSWEGVTLVENIPPLDWTIGMSVVAFSWLVINMWYHLRQVLSYIREASWASHREQTSRWWLLLQWRDGSSVLRWGWGPVSLIRKRNLSNQGREIVPKKLVPRLCFSQPDVYGRPGTSSDWISISKNCVSSSFLLSFWSLPELLEVQTEGWDSFALQQKHSIRVSLFYLGVWS